MLTISFLGNSQCAVDVVIQEGDTIEMCENALETLNASSGFETYNWTGPVSGNSQSITPTTSGQYVVAATDAVACVSTDTIEVIIYPAPVDAINSTEGSVLCPSSPGTTLSLSGSYILYDWGGGVTSPTLFATTGGTYSVTVADVNGCVNTFDFTITEPEFTLEASSNIACTGGSITLTASGGTNYSWSTGETGSSIVVSPAGTTTFSVVVTNGACTETLAIPVTMAEEEEFEMPDTIYMESGETELIVGPSGYQEYLWTPFTYINDPSNQNVYVTAGQSHTLYLEALHPGGCTYVDSVVIIVVQLTVPTGFSPNNDEKNDTFVIPELNEMVGSVTVWNRWGDIVFESDAYQNNWDGTCQGMFCVDSGVVPEGTYFYLIKVEEITKKGYLTIKQ